jgi:hypothetical protein
MRQRRHCGDRDAGPNAIMPAPTLIDVELVSTDGRCYEFDWSLTTVPGQCRRHCPGDNIMWGDITWTDLSMVGCWINGGTR